MLRDLAKKLCVLVLLILPVLGYDFNPGQLSFSAGEVSPLCKARADFAKYNSACLTLENFFVVPQGPAVKRQGTKFIADTNDGADISRLIPFEYSKTDAYILEFGDKYIRFFRNGGQIVNVYAAWVTSTAYVIGDLVSNGGSYYRCLIAHTSDAKFATDLAAVKWLLTAGATDLAYQIPTTYLKSEVFHIGYAQSADVMYLVEPNHPPAKLSRTAHTSWTLADISFTNGPFRDENIVETLTITPPATATDITVGQTFVASGETAGNEADHAFNDTIASANGWLSVNTEITDQWIRCQSTAFADYANWVTKTGYVVGDLVRTGTPYSYYRCVTAHTSGTFATDLAASKWTVSTKIITKVRIYPLHTTGQGTRNPKHLKFQGSNNGTDWTKLSVTKWRGRCEGYNTDEVYVDKIGTTGEWIELTLNNTTAYTYYRIFIYDNWAAADYIGVNEIEMMEEGSDTYTASSAIFNDPNHDNSLWRLNNPRQVSSISGPFTAVNWSDSIYLDGEWDFVTHGTYTAKLELQRTYDDGRTWQIYRVFDSVNDLPVQTNGIEQDNDVRYRVSCTVWTSGTCNYCLSSRSGTVDEIIKVSDVTDSTHIKADLQWGESYPSRATYNWSEGAWSDQRGWPATVEFHEERIAFGGSSSLPQTVWMSETADYEGMRGGEDDADALVYMLPGQNPLQWLISRTYLFLGSYGEIGRWGSSADGDPITPSNPTLYRRDIRHGSASVPAVVLGDTIIYVERDTRKVRQVSYSLERDTFTAPDMTILAEHITKGGIVGLCGQSVPDLRLWAIRDDGQVCTLNYDADQNVLGWSRFVTDGEVESVATIPGTEQDEVWMVVKRTIGVSTKRYVEQLAPRWDGITAADAYYVDCGLSFDGGATVNITAVTKAAVGVVTVAVWPTDGAGANLIDGQQVKITTVVGMTQLNGNIYTISNPNVGAKTFELRNSADSADVDTSAYGVWTSGGHVQRFEKDFTGLGHLEGEAVAILADGIARAEGKVASGAVSLLVWANKVHIGLPYTCKLQTMPMTANLQTGWVSAKNKRIVTASFDLQNSLSFSYGPDFTRLETATLTVPTSGWWTGTFPSGYAREQTVCVYQDAPTPLTIRAIIPLLQVTEQ